MREARTVMACAFGAAVFAAGLSAGLGTAGGGESAAVGATRLTAGLDARQEVPAPKGATADARGSFTATLERKGATGALAWHLTFRRLTGRATAAHVHLAKRGRPGPVALALCGPCRSGARGSVTAKAGVIQALLGGSTYVNVHTARNPAGEIRGQIRAGSTVSPPSTTTSMSTTSSTGEDPYP